MTTQPTEEETPEIGLREVLHSLIDKVPHPSQTHANYLHSAVERELGPEPEPVDPAIEAQKRADARAELQAQLDALAEDDTVEYVEPVE